MFASNFETENRSFKARKNTTAIVATVVVHGLILLFLIFTILHTPVPPFEDNAGGMAVNFGTDEAASGDEQPFTYNPGASASSPPPSQSQPQASSQEELLSQDEEESEVEAPKVDKNKTKVNNDAILKPTKPTNSTTTPPNKNKPVDNTPPQPKANEEALFPGSKGAKGPPKSGSDGTGGPSGDQGHPNGDPNSRNYEGEPGTGDRPGPGGMGNTYALKGRTRTRATTPAKCNTPGKVIVDIKVDRNGNVIYAKANRLKSTALDPCNLQNAENAARLDTYNVNSNADEIQVGTATYVYKVQ